MAMQKTMDGSVVDSSGRTLFFSAERFARDISAGGCCFICGNSPRRGKFTDEHILPKWILKRFNLFDRQVTLPNDTGFKYDRYTIPCCADCNALMGDRIESPIRSIIEGGFDSVAAYLRSEGSALFFVWLALIFLKTHLRDQSLRISKDHRDGDDRIGELYEWPDLHHIHCIARSFYTGATIAREAFGSFIILPAKQVENVRFDYGDLYQCRSIMMRLDDVAIIAVLNDSTAALSKFVEVGNFDRISGPLTALQIREVFAHFSTLNLKLKTRPRFATVIRNESEIEIVANIPSRFEIDEWSWTDFGEIFDACTFPMLARSSVGLNSTMRENIRAGRWSFLFDQYGRFIEN